MSLKNLRLTDDEFAKEREQVLATWPTGKDVNLDEAVAYHRNMLSNRIYASKLDEAKLSGTPLNYTYIGTPVLEWQLDLMKRSRTEGGSGLLTVHGDSFTRNQLWQKAADAVVESQKTGKVLLNGFPIGIHGVAASRKIIESTDTAIMISGTACDWRFTQEVGLAGGYTASCGDPFFPFFCYNKTATLETLIRHWQYVFRLRGYYEERGCPIVTKTDGVEAALCPSSVEDACRIISYLIAAEQGCKHFLCHMVAGCNLAQDLAQAISLEKLAREYLDKFGYKDAVLYGGIQSWNGRYPWERASAFPICMTASIIAVLAKLQTSALFTVEESRGIPTVDAQIDTLRCANMLVNLYKDQNFDIYSQQVQTEEKMHQLEVRAILDKVTEMGDGDVVVGSIRAVDAGVLDIPFSTSRFAARKVMGVRDAEGAGRYLDTGNLPFSNEIKEFHKQKIAERAKKQGSEVTYDTVIKDILSISEGYLVM